VPRSRLDGSGYLSVARVRIPDSLFPDGLSGSTISSGALAEDTLSNTEPQSGAPADMSRTEWGERVAEAKRRAREVRLAQRRRAVFDEPSIADEERLASERVLNDDSLQSGDIVSTNKGLFVFKGRPDLERSDGDFVPLAPR